MQPPRHFSVRFANLPPYNENPLGSGEDAARLRAQYEQLQEVHEMLRQKIEHLVDQNQRLRQECEHTRDRMWLLQALAERSRPIIRGAAQITGDAEHLALLHKYTEVLGPEEAFDA